MKIFNLTLYFFVSILITDNASSSNEDNFHSKLIGGEIVPATDFPEILKIEISGASCTATVVGPQVILTAAHCRYGQTARFTTAGRSYTATLVNHSSYRAGDSNGNPDFALGYVSSEIERVKPVSIGGVPRTGMNLLLFGYGCINSSRKTDGNLRRGTNIVASVASQRFKIYRNSPGAAACYGDSGGPAFFASGSKLFQIGVHSMGNIKDMTLDTRLDTRTAQSFMKSFAKGYQVKICGVTASCP